MAEDQQPELAPDRIERLIEVLSLLTIGAYDPALSSIVVGDDGSRFAVLEQGLGLFVRELAEAREESEAHLSSLEAEKLESERKLEIIERQQLALHDLSTPIIELWDDVLTLPIVGTVDTQRSLEMTEQLLQRISSQGARCVIVDVTGIDVVDTMTANHFIQMIRAAQLLGAYCVVTGLSPHIAQTIVGLGVEMEGIRTLRSLKEGLKHCLEYLSRQRGNSPWKR